MRVKFNFVFKNNFAVCISFLFVVVGWVFFSQPTVAQAVRYIEVMLSFNVETRYYNLAHFLTYDKVAVLISAIFFAFYKFDSFYEESGNTTLSLACKFCFSLLLLVLSCANMALYGFKPFIYFQF